MSNSKLIELSYYDPSAQVRLSAYLQKSISALKISSESVQMDQNTGQQGSLLPCWTMQNGRTSIRLSSVP